MAKGQMVRGTGVPGREVSDTVLAVAKDMGIKATRSDNPYNSGQIHTIHLSKYSGRKIGGFFPVMDKATMYVDPNTTYSSYASAPMAGSTSSFQPLVEKLHQTTAKRYS